MEKRRNGLLEIYRFILCFWPMYHHNFFFFTKGDKFSLAELAVDFSTDEGYDVGGHVQAK